MKAEEKTKRLLILEYSKFDSISSSRIVESSCFHVIWFAITFSLSKYYFSSQFLIYLHDIMSKYKTINQNQWIALIFN